MCVCESRQCPEHFIATCRVVNYCTGNSNMHSSSFGIPLPQGGPQASALRHGEKTHTNTRFLTLMCPHSSLQHVSVSCLAYSPVRNWSQSMITCTTTNSSLCVCVCDVCDVHSSCLPSLASCTAETLQILTYSVYPSDTSVFFSSLCLDLSVSEVCLI